MSDIDTAAADSLKVLDPKRPIREADIRPRDQDVGRLVEVIRIIKSKRPFGTRMNTCKNCDEESKQKGPSRSRRLRPRF